MRFFGILCCCFSDLSDTDDKYKYHSTIPEEYCRRFSLAELRKATNNFDESLIIGNGGFGRVYRGHLAMTTETCWSETTKTIAIKRRSRNSSQQQEFSQISRYEIQLLSQLQHPNILPLVGYCDDRGEDILVYDYMGNGSLHRHLYGDACTEPLSWKKRLEICIGVARGLHYLHTRVKHDIIHGDIKSSNILLDENFLPKITDFGFSERGPLRMSKNPIRIEDRRITGIFGYKAPEYLVDGKYTEKFDVYSFGMLLMEVVCAKTSMYLIQEQHPYQLPDKNPILEVFECVRQGNTDTILDQFLVGKSTPECLMRYMSIAEKCLNDETTNRPAMGEVEVELEHVLQLQENADCIRSE